MNSSDLSPRHTSGLIFVCGCGWRGQEQSAAKHTVRQHGMHPTNRYDHIECRDCEHGQRPLLGSGLVTGCAMLPTYIA
jgi:hypothetical protein